MISFAGGRWRSGGARRSRRPPHGSSRSTIVPAATTTRSPTADVGESRVEARRRDRRSRRRAGGIDLDDRAGERRCTSGRSSPGAASRRPGRPSRRSASATARTARRTAVGERRQGGLDPARQRMRRGRSGGPPMTTIRPTSGRPRIMSATPMTSGKASACEERGRGVTDRCRGARAAAARGSLPARCPVAASTMTTAPVLGTPRRSSMSSWPTARTRVAGRGQVDAEAAGGERRPVVAPVGRTADEDVDRPGRPVQVSDRGRS